jgi:cell division protein FtsI/penicillin-binding protein 2
MLSIGNRQSKTGHFMSRSLNLVLAYSLAASSLPAASLDDQSVARLLAKHYHSSDLSYILIDADTRRVIASRWDAIAEPVPVGSLVKPFLALAYGQQHNFRYPAFYCHGAADGCWLPRGHGKVDISAAIAYSCNAYFLNLAASLKPEDVDSMAHRYGLSMGNIPLDTAEMIGLGGAWRVEPEELLRAYLRLAAAPQPAGAAELLRGMALCARRGTAEAVDRSLHGLAALAKTGTAPCVHQPRAPGDGYVLMLYPAEEPRWALLVRVHGVPGARAAQVGGRMLSSVVNVQ